MPRVIGLLNVASLIGHVHQIGGRTMPENSGNRAAPGKIKGDGNRVIFEPTEFLFRSGFHGASTANWLLFGIHLCHAKPACQCQNRQESNVRSFHDQLAHRSNLKMVLIFGHCA